MENEKEYQAILEAINIMRSNLVSSIEELITFGGQIPENIQNRLKKLAFLTGDIFLLAKEDGGEFADGNKPGLISLTIGEKVYTCGRNAMRETIGFTIPQKTFSQKESFEKKPLPSSDANEWSRDTPLNKEEKEVFIPEEKEQDIPSFSVEKVEETIKTPSFVEFEESIEEKNDVFDFMEETTENLSQEENENPIKDEMEVVEEKEEYIGAQVIGGEVSVKPATHADIFVEERQKAGKEFIFDSYVLDVVHSDAISRGRGSKMYAMIAPLKVTKFASNNVPIVVTLVNEGKIVTRSSYDSEEDGKNMVNIDINEFYFLVRGAFDENGNFMSQIVTTGLSNDAGDRINILNKESNGNSKNAKNGHIKFRYDTPEGPGVIEVFPWSIGENEFTIVSKNTEFIDYLNISPKSRGLVRPILHTDKGRVEVVCSWDDDNLDVDLIDI